MVYINSPQLKISLGNNIYTCSVYEFSYVLNKSSTGLSGKFPEKQQRMLSYGVNEFLCCLSACRCMGCVCVCRFRSVICSCCFYWINDARVAADDAAGVAELEADSPFLPLCLSFSSLPPVFYTIRSTLLLLLFF